MNFNFPFGPRPESQHQNIICANTVYVDDENDEDDEDMRVAIAASLQTYESEYTKQQVYQRQRQQHAPPPLYTPQQQQASPPLYTSQQYHDLLPADEEQINLFITLMRSIKKDPKKRNNIMYNKNLNELYAKVAKLRPKLNKSLRNSIERYETFLEMNNKISTITKLYDQFLEQKLSMAYGNHTIGSQMIGGQPPQESYGYSQQLAQQESQHVPQQESQHVPQQESQQESQPSGPSISQQQPGVSQQLTGTSPEFQSKQPFQNYQLAHEKAQRVKSFVTEPEPLIELW